MTKTRSVSRDFTSDFTEIKDYKKILWTTA